MEGYIYKIDEIAKITENVFINNGVRRAYLFGSYAAGNPDPKSDIDIVMDTDGKMPYLRVCRVSEELREVLHKKVDLFDIREIKPDSGMMREITGKGVLLYEKERHGYTEENDAVLPRSY
ncbi:MAG: nucleotidyltransferase domain-containing protein [Oscillospiraceae bacterium]|nr:nucleotidyltransferase domain-containing protein [Oscillospiraceae bacterium]